MHVEKTINILMSLRRVYRSSRLRFSDVRNTGIGFFLHVIKFYHFEKKEVKYFSDYE